MTDSFSVGLVVALPGYRAHRRGWPIPSWLASWLTRKRTYTPPTRVSSVVVYPVIAPQTAQCPRLAAARDVGSPLQPHDSAGRGSAWKLYGSLSRPDSTAPARRPTLKLRNDQHTPGTDPHPPGLARSSQAGGHRYDPAWILL